MYHYAHSEVTLSMLTLFCSHKTFPSFQTETLDLLLFIPLRRYFLKKSKLADQKIKLHPNKISANSKPQPICIGFMKNQ